MFWSRLFRWIRWTPPEPPPSRPPSESISRCIAAINAHRANHDRKGLQHSPCLSRQAQAWVETMNRTGEFSHNGMLARLAACGSKNGSENIYRGSDVAEYVCIQWMGSDGHRTNMLGWSYSRAGVGHYRGHWVALFSE